MVSSNHTTFSPQPTPLAPPPTPGSAIEQSTIISGLLDWHEQHKIALEPRDQDGALQLATDMAAAKVLGVDSPADGMARIMMGRSLGLPAMASLQTIALIWNPSANDGKGTFTAVMYARAKLALMYRDKHIIEYIEPTELSNEKATWVGKRVKGRKEVSYTFTIEDARIAGLVDRGGNDRAKALNNYNRHPGPMLQWRACGRLCDLLGAEILLGIGTREDVEDDIAVKRAIAEAASEVVERIRPTPSVSLEDRLKDRPAASPPPLPETTPSRPRDFAAEAEKLKAEIAEAVKTKDPAAKKRVRAAFQAFEKDAPPPEVYAGVLEFYNALIGKNGAAAAAAPAAPQATTPAATAATPSPAAASPTPKSDPAEPAPAPAPARAGKSTVRDVQPLQRLASIPGDHCTVCTHAVTGLGVKTVDDDGVIGLRHADCPPPVLREPDDDLGGRL